MVKLILNLSKAFHIISFVWCSPSASWLGNGQSLLSLEKTYCSCYNSVLKLLYRKLPNTVKTISTNKNKFNKKYWTIVSTELHVYKYKLIKKYNKQIK